LLVAGKEIRMGYSRKNLKKLLVIADGLDGLLGAKERLSRDVEVAVENGSDWIKLALAKMKIEAAIDATQEVKQLELRLAFPSVTQIEEVAAVRGPGRQEVKNAGCQTDSEGV
jgi:hypothetical protein